MISSLFAYNRIHLKENGIRFTPLFPKFIQDLSSFSKSYFPWTTLWRHRLFHDLIASLPDYLPTTDLSDLDSWGLRIDSLEIRICG
jgi:hypothetical protein